MKALVLESMVYTVIVQWFCRDVINDRINHNSHRISFITCTEFIKYVFCGFIRILNISRFGFLLKYFFPLDAKESPWICFLSLDTTAVLIDIFPRAFLLNIIHIFLSLHFALFLIYFTFCLSDLFFLLFPLTTCSRYSAIPYQNKMALYYFYLSTDISMYI